MNQPESDALMTHPASFNPARRTPIARSIEAGRAVALAALPLALLAACATPRSGTPLSTRPIEIVDQARAAASSPLAANATGEAAARAAQIESRPDGTAPGGSERASARDAVAGNAALIHRGSGPLVAPPAAQRSSDQPGAVSLNFEAADVREVAKAVLADILNQNYIVDPRVQGTVTLRTVRPLPRDALLPTLESVLRLNGVVMVLENGLYKLMPSAAARGSVAPRAPGALGGYGVQVVPLKFIGVREMARLLEPFAPEGGIVRQDDARNVIVLAGTQNEMRVMLDTIETFDVDWLAGMSVGLFPLANSDVRNVAPDLNRALGERANELLAGLIRIVPMERMNAILVITPQPRYLDLAKTLIERIDRSGAGGQQLYVYHVQNSKAENLAQLLSQAFGGQGAGTQTPGAQVAPGRTPTQLGAIGTGTTPVTTPSSMPGGARPPGAAPAPAAAASTAPTAAAIQGGEGTGLASNARIIGDKENNLLLILATAQDYEKIEQAIRRLDTIPRQVLIEVTLAEVTLSDDMQFGVEWTFRGRTSQGPAVGTLDMGAAGIAALAPGFSYALSAASGTDLKAVLNALASQNRVNVLSSPHIMVADNQAARIQVGDSVPIAGPQTITGTGPVVTSVQYIETGIILNVTPRINASGLVTLDIQQEVSNATPTTTSGLNSPTISKRSTKSMVTIQSGETMVLGGLISENRSRSSGGLPVLSNVPVVGALFGTQGYKNSKTELVVLITPYIASNVAQAKSVSEEFRRKLTDIEPMLRRDRPQLFTPPAVLQEKVVPSPVASPLPSTAPRQSFATPER